jgi:hypothetical protein
MVVSNIMEEETTLPSQEVPVDGRGSTALEVPLLAAVVWQIGISVVEVSDHDD